MKYETEYKMIMDDPHTQNCVKAGRKLRQSLQKVMGSERVVATGIGLNEAKDGPAIYVYLASEDDAGKIPAVADEFPVITRVIQKVEPGVAKS